MSKNKLSLKKIEKSIAGKKILSDISFSVSEYEIVGLLGPNGAGKTTAFYIAAGLLFPDNGCVEIDGHVVTNLPMHKRSKVGLSYLPQEASIFQGLTVEENLRGIAELKMNIEVDRINFFDMVVDEFGLENILMQKGQLLSGGQRRKVEIARTLACNPTILLLDEPFAGIDPIAIEDIKALLNKIVARGISILITDHNVKETLNLCSRAIIMDAGQVIAEGTSQELIANDLVKKTYFGKMYT
ncbi:LPS export ABC transporter ATP-binding protein [Gammaproteobacteria bacterium]|jgi:lipopolysaccharide export system ATP-binding protein|nr:LPS export ABC transporter ATP-binding protein [Gammaproteobacteria bacterium]